MEMFHILTSQRFREKLGYQQTKQLFSQREMSKLKKKRKLAPAGEFTLVE